MTCRWSLLVIHHEKKSRGLEQPTLEVTLSGTRNRLQGQCVVWWVCVLAHFNCLHSVLASCLGGSDMLTYRNITYHADRLTYRNITYHATTFQYPSPFRVLTVAMESCFVQISQQSVCHRMGLTDVRNRRVGSAVRMQDEIYQKLTKINRPQTDHWHTRDRPQTTDTPQTNDRALTYNRPVAHHWHTRQKTSTR